MYLCCMFKGALITLNLYTKIFLNYPRYVLMSFLSPNPSLGSITTQASAQWSRVLFKDGYNTRCSSHFPRFSPTALHHLLVLTSSLFSRAFQISSTELSLNNNVILSDFHYTLLSANNMTIQTPVVNLPMTFYTLYFHFITHRALCLMINYI